MSSHWSEYWQQGHLTSFGNSFNLSYSGELKHVWDALFETLDDGFNSLDLATGNGAIPILLDQFTREKNIRGAIEAIDLATINTSAIKKKYRFFNEIEFKSQISCEQVSTLEQKFDLITSQFGIEYSDIEKSLIACKSVLKPDGIIGLVCHHNNSHIIKRNKATYNVLIDDTFTQCVKYFFGLIRASFCVKSKNDIALLKKNEQAEHCRKGLNVTLQRLTESNEQGLIDSELPNYIQTFMRTGIIWSESEKKSYIEHITLQLETLRLRLDELVNAALSVPEVAMLKTFCSINKLELISQEQIHDNTGQLVAWFLTLKSH